MSPQQIKSLANSLRQSFSIAGWKGPGYYLKSFTLTAGGDDEDCPMFSRSRGLGSEELVDLFRALRFLGTVESPRCGINSLTLISTIVNWRSGVSIGIPLTRDLEVAFLALLCSPSMFGLVVQGIQMPGNFLQNTSITRLGLIKVCPKYREDGDGCFDGLKRLFHMPRSDLDADIPEEPVKFPILSLFITDLKYTFDEDARASIRKVKILHVLPPTRTDAARACDLIHEVGPSLKKLRIWHHGNKIYMPRRLEPPASWNIDFSKMQGLKVITLNFDATHNRKVIMDDLFTVLDSFDQPLDHLARISIELRLAVINPSVDFNHGIFADPRWRVFDKCLSASGDGALYPSLAAVDILLKIKVTITVPHQLDASLRATRAAEMFDNDKFMDTTRTLLRTETLPHVVASSIRLTDSVTVETVMNIEDPDEWDDDPLI